MKELAEWSLRASLYRMQIRYLMDHEGLNSQKKSVSDKVYVSPYDIEALAEELEFAEDVIASISRQLNRAVVEKKKREYAFYVRSTPSAQSIDDYLSVLEDSCKQGIALVKETQTVATAFSKYYDDYISNTESDETNKKFQELSKSATNVKTTLSSSLELVGDLLKKRSQLNGLAEKDPAKAAELLQEFETKLAELAKAMNSDLVKAEILNTDLMVYGAKTHQLLTKLGDTEKAKNARKQGEALLAKWGVRQLEINKTAIPDLKRRKLLLKAGGWVAKGARWGVEGYSAYKDYQKNLNTLSTTDLGGGAEDAVLALTVAGKAMEKIIDTIPIPVLDDCLKGYAKILSDSAKWAVAVDSAQARMYQDLGFDIRSTSPPKAYAAILEKYSNDAKPSLFFNRMRMPLAEYNGLIVMATPDQDMKWLVWNKHLADGYLLIDKETHRKISQYSAWFRRVYDKNISGEALHDLLTKKQTDIGLVFEDMLTPPDLESTAKKLLELKALKAYLTSMTSKRALKEAEIANYRAMLFQAASQYAEQGFLLTDADIKELMQAVVIEEPIPGAWQTAYNLVTLTPGNADRLNQEYLAWDKLHGEEKGRLEAALKKHIQAKVERRTKAREKNWKEAKLGGDDGKPIAAGLLYSQVGIIFNHALFSKEEEVYADDFLDITDDTFTISWKTTIPAGVDLTHATYLGIAEIAGYPNTRIQIATPIETNKNEILEEMIALAEEAEELGNTAWSSCQQAVDAFTPFEEKKEEIKQLITELKVKTDTLKALSFKVESIPGKLSHSLIESKKLAADIEKYADQVKQLADEICQFGGMLNSEERGQQISLLAKIHTPLAQLQKKNQLLNLAQDKAQKELTLWDDFKTTLEELETLISNSESWTTPLIEEFSESMKQLAAAEKSKQEMSRIKARADRLLQQANKVYSEPESTETLEEIKIAHGRVLHPLNELTGCLQLAADKKSTAVPLGNDLVMSLQQAEKSVEEATKVKEKLDARQPSIEALVDELSLLIGGASERVLNAENAMNNAQLCFDQFAETGLTAVPDLSGMSVSQARKKLAAVGLQTVLTGGSPAPSKAQEFHVASQDPEVGTQLPSGSLVSVVVFSNYLGITVPNVEGLAVKEAKNKLTAAGLVPELAGGDSAPEKGLEYKVESQSPTAGEKVAADSSVTLKVYGPVQYMSVPSIVGMTAAQAKSTLTAAGLKASLYGGDVAPQKTLSYKIATQSPEAGVQVIMGSVVSAHVYGNFDKEAALAQKTCENFPGTTIQWDDAKDTAWCVCPSGQIWSKERNQCIADPQVAERKRNRQQFWNAVISTAVPVIVNEIASGGNSSTSGTSDGNTSGNNRSGNNSNPSGSGRGNSSGGGGGDTGSTTSKPGGDPKECEIKYCPSCADTGIDLIGVAVNSQCTDCRKAKGAQIASCIRGEKSGQGTKYVRPDYIVICYEKWNPTTEKYECGPTSIVKTSAPRKGRIRELFGPATWSDCYDKEQEIFKERYGGWR